MGITLSTRLFIERGHEVTLVSLDDPAKARDYKIPGDFIPIGPGKSSFGYCPNLDRWLSENLKHFDTVIIHGTWQYHGFATWRATRCLGKEAPPYFVFTHGMLDPWFKRAYPLKHLKKWLYWPWGEYRVLRDARAVLFTSEEEKLLARESFWLYRANEQVVSYGTLAPAISEEDIKTIWSKLCPAKLTGPYLLFLGRLHIKKGLDLLISAYRDLKASGCQLPDLVIAGPEQDPTFAKEIKKQAADDPQIHFIGMLSGNDKWAALANADALILPSHQENFGIVVAESLAMGTPVLVSNKVNIWREIDSDGAGFVAHDNLAGTKQLLASFLDIPVEKKQAMRLAAKRSFESRFELERSIDELIGIITP